jgi:hypothetical protein
LLPSLTAALFFMAAPLPLGAQVLADLILRPAEEPPLLHEFNRVRGHPPRNLVAAGLSATDLFGAADILGIKPTGK